jgi:plasmid stabilization system protein ParE
MERRGDPSQTAALSLLAGLTLRDLEEIEGAGSEPVVSEGDELKARRLRSVRDLFQAVQRGADPLYARPTEIGGGSLLAKTDLHRQIASLDDDVETFLLVARLRHEDEQPEEISAWAKRCEALVEALLEGSWSQMDEGADRAVAEADLRFFLEQLERLDEIASDRPSHELL